MIRGVGDVGKLRPHVKTHKLAKVVALKLAAGITKFKAATIAEVEMVLAAGGRDVLLAYQPVGPNISRLVKLTQQYPNSMISTLVDDQLILRQLSRSAVDAGINIPVYLDLDVGMHRTGAAIDRAEALYRELASSQGLIAAGFHAYDGHLHDADYESLVRQTSAAFEPVWRLRDALEREGISVGNIIASGTPTSNLLAKHDRVEVGAGTTVLWDAGQSLYCPTLKFLNAAVVLTRVISRPTEQLLCLDVGHKAVASEFPPPRIKLFGLEDATQVSHSEEHLLISTPRASDFPPGSVIYGLPYHVCPTIALHQYVWCVEGRKAVEMWPVTARNRCLTI